MEKTAPDAQSVLIVIRGLPGSGKTYLAGALEAELRRRYGSDRVVVLDPDQVDTSSAAYAGHVRAQTADGVDPKLHLYRWSRAQAFAAIDARRTIIWNQAFTNLETFNKMIERLRGYARDHGTELELLVVEVEASEAAAKARIAERARETGRDISPEAYERFVAGYESWAGQGFTVVKVSGEDDVADSVAAVTRALPNNNVV